MGKDLGQEEVTANRNPRIGVFVIVFIAGLAAGALGLLCCADGESPANFPMSKAIDATKASTLFARACGLNNERLAKRMAAASSLASMKEGEPWVVLLILRYRDISPDESEGAIWPAYKPFELAVIYSAIKGLRSDAGLPLLWALCSLLEEKETALWSEERGFIIKRLGSYSSPPFRELVRNLLVQRLGVDREWNVSAWREAILEHRMSGNAESKPSSEASTRTD